ncbi:cadherin-16 isoform X1 [Bos indicus x Bos taurus]|uniref:Cadherin-16 n=1 Tax=Bos indicus x Bos taurus TaxID=30522 RepID=A0A4W2GEI7_BOBOX|nr:cadherin-16 isoform X1 [Bos indicus x Bos taurus]XP_027372159.1 cadherin-16 isoform X1 [Bos indicus x Bos taurus]XP_027372160.1 cadherin-16 isoform X1 [Bos indicus x Bos taurus]
MVAAWLWLLCFLVPQALPRAQPAELYVEVPENYGGNFPLYLTKLLLPREETEGQIVVSGDAGVAGEGLFAVDPESGFLLVTRALDREEQAEYQLQVTLETENRRVLWGPQPVRVRVKDENDQVPHFSQATYKVHLSRGTRPGVPFFFLEASDGDEPGTTNSDLRFHILNQAPAQPASDMFQLEPRLGALALSPEGSTSLEKALEGYYQLLVQVKDMGDQASGHQATATIDVSIVENTWVPLDPVHLAENLQVPYPHHIAQVHWNGGDVHYHLESQPQGPFDVDTEGKLYVTQELDREAQAEYLLQVRAQNTHSEDYAAPLELQVVVTDENDNAPICPPRGPSVSIPELSPPGTKVAKISAEDADAPSSPNSHVVYQLLSPEPEEPAELRAFELDSTSGSVTLGAAQLQAGQNILLQVLAMDLGGTDGGLSSTCEIPVTITDINDHAPEFTTSQIEPVSLPEDAEPGTLVTTLTATDADLEPAFRLMDFAIEAGDEEGTFSLDWEPDSAHVQLRLLKNLSYEAAPSHKLVVVVRNVEELVGPGPGPGATATVTVLVERVVPPPQLDRESYEASVPISTPAGSLLLTVQPSDPLSSPLRFSLVNDSEGWLCIKEISGEVHTARPLQGAQPGDMYTVLIEAQDADEPTLSTSATLVIHFLKALPAPTPTLAPVPSRHLCTPRQDHGVVVSGPREDPDQAGGHGPFSFALGPNPTVQRDWRLRALNGSHAYLTLGLHWVEPREHVVPIAVSHNDQIWQIQVRVIVCRCNVEGQCMRKVGRMKGMPTKLSAVGILVGTLIAIGIFLILIFTHLTLARKKDLDQPVDSVPLKVAV